MMKRVVGAVVILAVVIIVVVAAIRRDNFKSMVERDEALNQPPLPAEFTEMVIVPDTTATPQIDSTALITPDSLTK